MIFDVLDQYEIPPEPIPSAYDFNNSNDMSGHEYHLQDPTLSTSIDINRDTSPNRQTSPASLRYAETAWDTDVSDAYMLHLNKIMADDKNSRKSQSRSFDQFAPQEKPPSSLSVSQSPKKNFDTGSFATDERPQTRGKTPLYAPHHTPAVTTSLMNPILMEEEQRRVPRDQQLHNKQGLGDDIIPHMNKSMISTNNSGHLLLSQPLQPTSLTVEERHMIEEARDSLATGIRVANKTLGGLMDMQEWREYAANIMGQVLSGPENITENEHDKAVSEEEIADIPSLDEGLAAQERQRYAFLEALLSPQLLESLQQEASLSDSRYTAKNSLQQALRNLRFLGDYDNNFTHKDLDNNIEENTHGFGVMFDGELYNKIIDNTLGLLTKRFPHSGLIHILDTCFNMLEEIAGKVEDDPFKSMTMPGFSLNGGLRHHLEKVVLPKLSGLKTFNQGMTQSTLDMTQQERGILSSFQLEQVNKRIINNVLQDLMPVLQLLVDIEHLASGGNEEPKFSLDVNRSGDVVPSAIPQGNAISNSKTGTRQTTAASLVGLSAEYTGGELRLSAPISSNGNYKEVKSRERNDQRGRSYEFKGKGVRCSDRRSQYDEDEMSYEDCEEDFEDVDISIEDISPYGEEIERQVIEGREQAAQVYESWIQVKLLLESVISNSGAMNEKAAAELLGNVSRWYRHFVASGQVSGERSREKHGKRNGSRSLKRRNMDFYEKEMPSDDVDQYSDLGHSDNHSRRHKSVIDKSSHQASGMSVSRSPRTKEEIMDALAQSSDSDAVDIKSKSRLQKEAQISQDILDKQREEKERLAAEIERKEHEKLSTIAELERHQKAHTAKVLRSIDRIRKRMFTNWLWKRFHTWQIFTERQRACDTTASLVSNMQAQQEQMTAAERKKAEEQLQEKERQREELLRKERLLAEEQAKERSNEAEKALQLLLEQQKRKDAELMEEKISAITAEKERLLAEERRASSVEKARLLEERDKIIEEERNKEKALAEKIQSLVLQNDSILSTNEKKRHIASLLNVIGHHLDIAVKISFSKWVKFAINCRNVEMSSKEKKKTIKRMLRILLGVQKSSVKDTLQRAFRRWERSSNADRYLSIISSNEAETIANLRGRVVELQEEMLELTSTNDNSASWVAERALNRELSSANHDLQQRFSDLQWRLLEVSKVPASERKQLVNAVLLDREQEIAKSRKEVRVLREQVVALEKYLRLPATERPIMKENTNQGPETGDHDTKIKKHDSNKYKGNYDDVDEHEHPPNQSKFYRQKFQIGNKMTKQDALHVVLSEVKNLQYQNTTLKEDNIRKSTEVRFLTKVI